jgi:hypothetical protein
LRADQTGGKRQRLSFRNAQPTSRRSTATPHPTDWTINLRPSQVEDRWGSITKFDFRISRDVEVEGGRVDPISATCPDGELRALNRGEFEDGTKAETEVIRACTAEA